MSAWETVAHLAALFAGIFALLYGVAFWIAGMTNHRTSSFAQNVLAAAAFTGSLPY